MISSTALLVPDEIDDSSTLLPSFADLRQKNLNALYGTGDDKSPKGSVDAAIQSLVDLVNTHPSFVTLSSCSGRIAIFDPNGGNSDHPRDDIENGDKQTDDERIEGGKGRGEWIFVSHEQVIPSSIPPLLNNRKSTGKLILKHEPLLLHVAASTMQRGRQFLSIALQLGFRESGLVVTPNRVTVAIRSHSLALTVPLAYSGNLRPSDDYIMALVEEANQQMKVNMDKLHRLENEIKSSLFQSPSLEGSIMKKSYPRAIAQIESIPALNLWGHDAVAIPSDDGGTLIYVFGGYGSGPSNVTRKKKVERSNRIYSLQIQPDGTICTPWNEEQEQQPAFEPSQPLETEMTWFGVEVSPTWLPPTEGLRACLLPLVDLKNDGKPHSPVILIWGGRSGPGAPFGQKLLLYEPMTTKPNSLSCAVEVYGDLPSPRWGHSLTPLSGKDGMMAILLGGRDSNSCVQDNIYILRLLRLAEDGASCFRWTKIICNTLPPQFHHTVTSLGEDDLILVTGGLSNPNNLMESFSDSSQIKSKSARCSFFRVSSSNGLEAILSPLDDNFIAHYGSGSCCLTKKNHTAEQNIVLLAGGIPLTPTSHHQNNSSFEPLRWYTYDFDDDGSTVLNYEVEYSFRNVDKMIQLNFASMIHNCCLAIPGRSEILILGGGVSSFAFGPSFAECYRIGLKVGTPEQNTPSTSFVFASTGRGHKSIFDALRNQMAAPTMAKEKGLALIGKRNQIEEGEDSKTDVVYVENKNAKALRSALDAIGFLNKRFRMVKATETTRITAIAAGGDGTAIKGQLIAVPITTDALHCLSQGDAIAIPWISLVVGSGKQQMPFSTAVMGSNKKP